MSQTTSSRSWIWILIAGGVAIVLVQFGWLRTPGDAEVPEMAEDGTGEGRVSFLMEQQWLIRMQLAEVESRMLAPQVTAVGRIVPAPERHAVISPPVGGVISSPRLPGLGAEVRRGDVIAVLTEAPTAAEAAGLRMEANRIEAERRRLTEAREEARTRASFTESEAARARRLLERRAYSERQVAEAETAHAAARATLAAIEAQLDALGDADAPNTYEVRAPISGTVIRVGKRAGERVGPGEAIVELVETGTVWLEAPVFERDLGGISGEPTVRFATPAYPGQEFESRRVIDAGDVIDEGTRAAMFVFEVDNVGGLLRIGMQANVRIDAGTATETLVVPREAILDNEGQKIVYVLVSGEEFERRNVTVGDEYGDVVAILAGLDAGERVVTQGAYQLKLQELQPSDPGAHTHEV